MGIEVGVNKIEKLILYKWLTLYQSRNCIVNNKWWEGVLNLGLKLSRAACVRGNALAQMVSNGRLIRVPIGLRRMCFSSA